MIAESSDIRWGIWTHDGERGGIYPICLQPGNSRGLTPCVSRPCCSLPKQEISPKTS
jgi:hypothetical protein